MTGSLKAGCAGAALAAALAACTSTDSGSNAADGDTLDLGSGSGMVCLPAPPMDDDAVFGDTLIRHQESAPVDITAVALVEADKMSIVDAYLVRLGRGDDLVGIRYASDEGDMPAEWDQRVPAEGASLQAGEDWNLVVVLETPPRGTASAQAIRITYEHAGGTYWQDTVSSMIATHRSCDRFFSRDSSPSSTSSS